MSVSAASLLGWLTASDQELVRLCLIEPYQASGPGGQKRNRKFSAVRLVHKATGIAVTASESRSQAVNRRTALRKLRRALATQVECVGTIPFDDRTEVSPHADDYPLWLAKLFSLFRSHNFTLAETAAALDLSTGRLSRLLRKDPEIWKIVNDERRRRNLPELRS